jgi:hypothetical protein
VSAVAAVLVACSGTRPLPWLRGDLVNHPATLVGEWVDVQKSSLRDTSIWVLAPNGDDGGMRITRDSTGDGKVHVARHHYGYWYVRAAGTGAELCVTRRPGRDAPSCSAFEVVIDSGVVPPRRRIRIAAYAGAHHSGERILVQR